MVRKKSVPVRREHDVSLDTPGFSFLSDLFPNGGGGGVLVGAQGQHQKPMIDHGPRQRVSPFFFCLLFLDITEALLSMQPSPPPPSSPTKDMLVSTRRDSITPGQTAPFMKKRSPHSGSRAKRVCFPKPVSELEEPSSPTMVETEQPYLEEVQSVMSPDRPRKKRIILDDEEEETRPKAISQPLTRLGYTSISTGGALPPSGGSSQWVAFGKWPTQTPFPHADAPHLYLRKASPGKAFAQWGSQVESLDASALFGQGFPETEVISLCSKKDLVSFSLQDSLVILQR